MCGIIFFRLFNLLGNSVHYYVAHRNNMLDPQVIADVYTLAEIEAEITSKKSIYDNALKNLEYQLDDAHSRQRVRQHDIDKLSSELNVWLKAKSIKTGISLTKLVSITYTGSHN